MNLHSIHLAKWNEAWGACTLIESLCRGMQNYRKHNFLFQACVNMKPNPRKVLHGSSLCKNEPIPDLHLVIAIFIRWILLDEPWLFHSIATISFADHMLSLGCLSFPEEPQRWVVLLANLLTITCFEKFHHCRNQLLPFIPLVPLGRVPFKLFSNS